MMDPSYRRELLSLIVNAGLEEDFIEWLRTQGVKHLYGQLDNIPEELLLAYIREKKLEDAGEDIEASSPEAPEEPDGGVYVRSKRR
ncbi:hypothetical protein [Desulfurococcus mucosus]|uniref:Uncharacterized protein n=1 Tax=Desulfurococcus mucosus (strain ATCC 35584 / DSM 2162 / JCM 9187 / O7/1) TaxID=765177 RepID=E8RA01_DESM0|nr:hypothetical protein [Desulfurococcus mucosus]ADV65327.1 hypothetical protein Desmu_1025 [Desulfurococcus mucosus DSM 2162]